MSEAKSDHKWGYKDTEFRIEDGEVMMTGDKYNLCGIKMPSFIPFLEESIELKLDKENLQKENDLAVSVYKSIENRKYARPQQAILNKLLQDRRLAGKIKNTGPERLRHSHGQLSVGEIHNIIYNKKLDLRIVDLVFYPAGEDDVDYIISVAKKYDLTIIPYGGGTNVSGALLCPPNNRKIVVSVDMGRMNRILWIDKINNQACVEAGILGRKLEEELGREGYTAGHEPDSIEFSTLGGWISTYASGMKRSKYGNIEEIVKNITVYTPNGKIESGELGHVADESVTTRKSIGILPHLLFFGSEGNLGIITKAIIKIHKAPEEKRYGSLVFPDFANGTNFLHALYQKEIVPASIRLVDNNQFRFGQALKPAGSFLHRIGQKIQKFMLFKVLGFQLKKMVAATYVLEGEKEKNSTDEKMIIALAKKHKGISGGSENGKRGYMLTFGIAYIRDFLSKYYVVGETFETSVPWDKIQQVTKAVEDKLEYLYSNYYSVFEKDKSKKLPGKPFLSYRITQLYHNGVCVYFMLGFYHKDVENISKVFNNIEHELRNEILKNGGSLSHHHGVGKIRSEFIGQYNVLSGDTVGLLKSIKQSVDPKNNFAANNNVFQK